MGSDSARPPYGCAEPAHDGDDLLVGRENVLAAIVDGPPAGFHDLTGVAGAGKSALLLQLNITLRSRGVTVVHISGGRIPSARQSVPGAPAVVAQRTLLSSCAEVVRLMAYDLAQNGEPVEEHGDAACGGLLADRLAAAVRDALLAADLPQLPHGATDGMHARLCDKVAGMLSAGSRPSSRLAVLIDEFDRIEATPVGAWLLALLGRLHSTLRVVARRPGRATVPGAVTHVLGALSAQDIADYLCRRLGSVDPRATATRPATVLEVTGGHPLSVAIAADLLAGLGPHADLSALLGGGPTDDAAGDRIDLLCRSLDQLIVHQWHQESGGGVPPLSLSLLDNLSVVRRFDMALLAALLSESTAEEDDVLDVMLVLIGKSFVVGFDDDDDAGLRVHRWISEEREGRLAAIDSARHQQLHKRMERHYQSQLDGFDTDPELDTQYRSWHRLEHPDWRRLAREWLFHAARANTRPHEIRLSCARMFFDAFFWFARVSQLCGEADQLLEDLADLLGGAVSCDDVGNSVAEQLTAQGGVHVLE
ncbi:MAG: ATP-binding protein, partial [Streptomycetaceae bacterium]|nr:ATP-binding protein [Streptomycetaceae bacterium]